MAVSVAKRKKVGRLSEDLSEERGTGLVKKRIIYIGGIFINKTVYIGKQGYDNKIYAKLFYYIFLLFNDTFFYYYIL